jgi:hypothetical protein
VGTKDKIFEGLTEAAVFVFSVVLIGIFLVPICGIGYRFYRFLRYAKWPEITLTTFGIPTLEITDWKGIRLIQEFIWSSPFELVFIGAIISAVALVFYTLWNIGFFEDE